MRFTQAFAIAGLSASLVVALPIGSTGSVLGNVGSGVHPVITSSGTTIDGVGTVVDGVGGIVGGVGTTVGGVGSTVNTVARMLLEKTSLSAPVFLTVFTLLSPRLA